MAEPTHIHIETGAKVFPDGYDEADIRELTPEEVTIGAEQTALAKVEAEAEQSSPISRQHRAGVILSLWDELQRLKLANLVTGGVPSTVEERRKAFPGLMALVALSGKNLPTVAAEVELRLWDRVRKLHLDHAKLMLAHDEIRAATTAEAKLAASQVNWAE